MADQNKSRKDLLEEVARLRARVAELATNALAADSEAERLRQIIDSDQLGIAIWDEEGRLEEANDSFLEIVGYSREDIRERLLSWRDLTPPEYLANSESARAETAEFEPYAPREQEYIHKNGRRIRVLVGAEQFPFDGGVSFLLDRSAQCADESPLRTSEQWFRMLIENSTDVILLLNREATFVYQSPSVKRVLGYEPDEMIGCPAAEFIHPEDVKRVRSIFRNFVAQPDAIGTLDVRIRHRDGGWRWMASTAANRLSDPVVGAIVVNCHDITDRKRVEQRLRAQIAGASVLSEALQLEKTALRLLVAICKSLGWDFSALWLLDEQSGKLHCHAHWQCEEIESDGFSRLTRELVFRRGKGLPGYIWAMGRPLWVRDLQSVPGVIRLREAQSAGLHTCAGVPVQFGGRFFGVMEFYSREVLERDEEMLSTLSALGTQLGQFIDRSRTEEALKTSEARYRRIVETTREGVWTIDSAGRTTFVNRRMAEMIGDEVEDMIGRPLVEFTFAQDAERVQLDLTRLREGRSEQCEFRFRCRNGSALWALLSSSRLMSDAGEMTGLLLIVTDITERRALEEQFRQAQKMEAIGRLAGGVAHDFNNLLTIISGYSELLTARLHPQDPAARLVGEIRRAGERAAALTRQLLAFSRKSVLEPKLIDLNALITESEHMIRRLIGEDIEFETILDKRLGRVRVDPGQMDQVILNLIINSRDAMPQGGRLMIETRNVELDESYAQHRPGVKPGSYVLLAVSDTGCGMSDEVKAQIFEPFFTTKAKGQGTGLGLATVYGIINQSGGHISVYSEPEHGTTFKIYLPCVASRAPVKVYERTTRPPRTGYETVLLVEDEDALRGFVRQVLEAAGYTVLEAASGPEALQMVDEYRGSIHLLLTDVIMPQMSGRQLAERVLDRQPTTRVLYISGYTDDAVVRHGVLQAEVAFLQKPFSPAALEAKVRAVLDGSR